jgi:farnesyl diphosphate synthase
MGAFADHLDEVADRLTVALDALLPRGDGAEGRLFSAMRYAALAGGKRMRPFLTITAGRMFDADERALLRAACAIECIHTYSLIHDDLPCMDDDDMRRGQPTVHRAYDEATAVLAGDALLTLAFEILADPKTSPEPDIRVALVAGLARASGGQGMVGGQAIDMAGRQIADDLSAIARMQRLKTGALISFSTEAGGIIGGATDEERQALSRYSHDLGLAYQIADDLLDATGDADAVGKAVGKDADRGKASFVALLGVEPARERVAMLASQAKGHLGIFGEKAALLSQAVDFVLDRES